MISVHLLLTGSQALILQVHCQTGQDSRSPPSYIWKDNSLENMQALSKTETFSGRSCSPDGGFEPPALEPF